MSTVLFARWITWNRVSVIGTVLAVSWLLETENIKMIIILVLICESNDLETMLFVCYKTENRLRKLN